MIQNFNTKTNKKAPLQVQREKERGREEEEKNMFLCIFHNTFPVFRQRAIFILHLDPPIT